MLVSVPAHTATVHAWTGDQIDALHTAHDPFQDALDAYAHSYRDSLGATPLPVLRMSVQLPLVMILGWWVAMLLPHQRHLRVRLVQAALAALARSRMR